MLGCPKWILCLNVAFAFASPVHADFRLEARQPPAGQTHDDSGGHPTDYYMHNHSDYITCNHAWYGRPRIRDCDQAIRQFPSAGAPRETFREFLGILGPWPARAATGVDGPPVRTPIVKTVGEFTTKRKDRTPFKEAAS